MTRAVEQSEWWARELGVDKVYELTGMPIDAHFSANKLLWIRKHDPEVLRRARWWLSVADLVNNRLCRAFVTDQSLASRTMLFDQRTRSWSPELLKAAGLDPELFPPPLISGTRVGEITPDAAKLTNLPTGTPVVLGGHDHLCGAYVTRQGQDMAVDSTGTAEVVVLPVSSYFPRRPAEAGYIPCYADVVPGRYVYVAKVGYAGALVEWLRREIFQGSGHEMEEEVVSEYQLLMDRIPSPLEFSGLVCYPTFGRPITPTWEPDAVGGAFLGLTIAHHNGHLLQAVLEGNGYSLRANIEAIERLAGLSIRDLRVVGGATQNTIWMQLKADITGRVVESVRMEEATVLGAAILAGVGVGRYGDHLEAARGVVIESRKWQPDNVRQAVYDRIYCQVYRSLPETLGPLNRVLERVKENDDER
ncbi:MAG: L-fuculokinase [Anaerolineae bacterium]